MKTFTPGPYFFRQNSAGNLRMYSRTTGETIAYVLSKEWGDYENAPEGEAALANSQLFRAAPDLLEKLELAYSLLVDLYTPQAIENDPKFASMREAITAAGGQSNERGNSIP